MIYIIHILGQQGLALHGKYKSGEEREELSSNCSSHAEEDLLTVANYLSGWKRVNTSFQNELLSIMALKILRR